jgi:Putative zinc-finger
MRISSGGSVKTGRLTKVNRCLAEGRRSFLERVAGIESGAECKRLEPKLSALADGEAGEEDLTVLRRHLRRCPAWPGTLREQYLAPGIIGAVAPTTLLGGVGTGWARLDDLVATVKVKAAALLRLPGRHRVVAGTARAAGRLGPARLYRVDQGPRPVGGRRCRSRRCGGRRRAGLDSTRPEAASASGREQTSIEQRTSRGPGSPDPRLVAERLRPHDPGLTAARARRKDPEPPANLEGLRAIASSENRVRLPPSRRPPGAPRVTVPPVTGPPPLCPAPLRSVKPLRVASAQVLRAAVTATTGTQATQPGRWSGARPRRRSAVTRTTGTQAIRAGPSCGAQRSPEATPPCLLE